MVVRKGRKVRKCRGHRTYGYGSHKKHRGKGSRGGRGQAGMHKHKWSYTVKYEPDHYGKKGFKRLYAVKEVKAINLRELDQMAERLLDQKLAEKIGDKIKIDVSKLGYDKVLGAGKVTRPLIIGAKHFSKGVAKKLEKAGGEAVKA
ncbi:MAG TPA: uL15 family ribosomal protein [archaeon]|nr:uL15 family ribosomal protein [archaeon]